MKRAIIYLSVVILCACSPPPQVVITEIVTVKITSTPEPTNTTIPTETFTPSPIPTHTPTEIPLEDIEGVLFFDHNGSGLQEEGEPHISNFRICVSVKGSEDNTCTTTDDSGKYSFESVGPIDQWVKVTFQDPNTEDPSKAYRFINVYKDSVLIPANKVNGIQIPEQHLNDTDLTTIESGLALKIGEVADIGLMQGFLTSPFSCDQEAPIGIWYDHNPGGKFLNWQASTSSMNNPAGVRISGDNHDGTDFAVPTGTYVLAMAPGIVNYADIIDTYHGNVLHITLEHIGKKFCTGTGHHSELLVNREDKVYRGQVIALSGQSGTSWPHVHLNVHFPCNNSDPPPTIDPFGVLFNTKDEIQKYSLWTIYNQINCP